jgi:HEAT repeat protein
MKKRQTQMIIGVLVGLVLIAVAICAFTLALDNSDPLYGGHTVEAWREQLNSHDQTGSNQAYLIVSGSIIPQLMDKMVHDTNDAQFKLSAVKLLNSLPGIHVKFMDANLRRSQATYAIGEMGLAAKSAIPKLIQAVNGPDTVVREPAIISLGRIRCDPDLVIPLLLHLLDDKNLNDDAAMALGYFGGLSKAAIPKLTLMLHAPDKDDRHAAREALKMIDSAAATQAGLR